MPANEIPPTPLYERGALNGISRRQKNHLPPFLKGDRGGFCCAVVLPKITAAYLLYKQSLTLTPAQQVRFATVENSNETLEKDMLVISKR